MINGKKVVVVMPAYNAEKTLEKTYNEIYKDIVDEVILTDDCSSDNTKNLAKELNITTILHEKNKDTSELHEKSPPFRTEILFYSSFQ